MHGLDAAGPDVDPGIGGFRVGWVGTHGARLGIPCKITARGKRAAGRAGISVQIGFHIYSRWPRLHAPPHARSIIGRACSAAQAEAQCICSYWGRGCRHRWCHVWRGLTSRPVPPTVSHKRRGWQQPWIANVVRPAEHHHTTTNANAPAARVTCAESGVHITRGAVEFDGRSKPSASWASGIRAEGRRRKDRANLGRRCQAVWGTS